MKTITNTYNVDLFSSNIISQYLGDMKMGIFDIETMGLNPTYSPIVLAGFMTITDEGKATITQYFSESPEDEPIILDSLINDFKSVDYLFTYNGKHFDLPFIEKRAYMFGMNNIDTNLYNLDLYLILNGYSQLKYIIKHLKQKNVEEYMGLAPLREDTISGADSIRLYEAFTNSLNPIEKKGLEDKILLHNHDDLIQLYKLMPILKTVDLHKSFNSLGFPVKGTNQWPDFNITSVKLTYSELKISGKYRGEPFLFMSYEDFKHPFSAEFKDDNTFLFKLRIDKLKGNIFINLASYFDSFDDLKKYPNYINNFLFISDGKTKNYLEINMFVKKFIMEFMSNITCQQSPAVLY